MRNHNVNDLTESLAKLRLDREDLVRELEATNRREYDLIREIHAAEAVAIAAAESIASREAEEDRNPYKKGQILSITNNLRNEFGITDKVVRLGKVLVMIRNSSTGRTI